MSQSGPSDKVVASRASDLTHPTRSPLQNPTHVRSTRRMLATGGGAAPLSPPAPAPTPALRVAFKPVPPAAVDPGLPDAFSPRPAAPAIPGLPDVFMAALLPPNDVFALVLDPGRMDAFRPGRMEAFRPAPGRMEALRAARGSMEAFRLTEGVAAAPPGRRMVVLIMVELRLVPERGGPEWGHWRVMHGKV